MCRLCLAFVLLVLAIPAVAAAQPADCAAAAAAAERAAAVPAQLLRTIALVESGRVDPASGRVAAWPWTINADGQGLFYPTKAAAIEAVRALRAAGVAEIDVGCLQISLLYHPDAFATLEQAFDPPANAAFAGRFLAALFRQTGDWAAAAAAYHSQTPALGAAYQARVLALWPRAGVAPMADPAGATPEYRALLRQQREDAARLLAQYGTRPVPPRRSTGSPNFRPVRPLMALRP